MAGARPPPTQVTTPVVALAPDSWASLRPGALVDAVGRLRLPTRPGPAAVLVDIDQPPVHLGRAPTMYALGDPPRQALREAVARFPAAPAGLVPSLVVGDESMLTEQTREQLRRTGLAHLTAVSGANVAIVLGAALLTARWLGVRGWALPLVGVVAIGAFVLLARPEPSVVRASAMGVVAVLGVVSGRAGRGIATLALVVTVLVLVDPWLARSIGFALSSAATAGIIVLARPWAHQASGWMPRPLAAALAVPLAAQLACTPLLVGMTGELSMSALPANLLAAPAVPPATVLGVVAALVGLVAPPVASVIAGLGMLPAGWIVLVAERCADLPGTVISWTWGVPLAVVGSVGLAILVPYLLRSPVAALAACAVLAVLLVRPASGWPPSGWLFVACDVGQGDALVLRSGPREAVVVDTGPDPTSLDRCLDDLGVTSVPLLMLSHFDADHVGGVHGVTRDREVTRALITVVDEPPAGAASVARWAADEGVALQRARPGQGGTVGDVTWTMLWPSRVIRGAGSASNQASLVTRVEVDGVSVLLTGDIEPEAQRAIGPVGAVDVLKVPHHGAGQQDPGFLAATSPAVAVVSVGADNTYGHPALSTLTMLDDLGALTVRTDRDGDTAVVRSDGAEGPDGPPLLVVVRRGSW